MFQASSGVGAKVRELQAEMIEAEPNVFERVPGTWGARDWTSPALYAVEEELLRRMLLAAWTTTAPSGLIAHYDGLTLDP